MSCEHKYAYIKEERLKGENGRDYIERLSENDKKYQINSKGTLAQNNAFGEIISYCPDCELKIPVICGHGGSMWLCRKCKERILKAEIIE